MKVISRTDTVKTGSVINGDTLTANAVVSTALDVQRDEVVAGSVRWLLCEEATRDLLREGLVVRLRRFVRQAADEPVDSAAVCVEHLQRTVHRLQPMEATHTALKSRY